MSGAARGPRLLRPGRRRGACGDRARAICCRARRCTRPSSTPPSSAIAPRSRPASIRGGSTRPWLRPRFRALLPMYPAYFSTLDLRDRELVLSNSSAFAKAARTGRRPRMSHTSRRRCALRGSTRCTRVDRACRCRRELPARLLGAPLRTWDRRTSQRPDVLVANSQNIRDRISRFWGRDSEVIYPPVDVAEFDVRLATTAICSLPRVSWPIGASISR